jgi:integrase
MRYALQEAAKLQDGIAEIVTGRITLSRLVGLYLAKRTPRKVQSEQLSDHRRAELWLRWLGAEKDPHKITLDEWESFTAVRRAGAIDALGCPVAEDERRRVRDRTVEADLIWLKLVLNWGTNWRSESGYLLRENPVRGFELPSEKNVRRPVATQDRFEAIRLVSDRVTMEVRWDGRRRVKRSYLSELLDIVNGTGRRISAVCSLRYDDLRLDAAPHGAIRWRADADKTGRESVVPISRQVRAAVDRILSERPGVGAAFLFPSPTDLGQPISRYLASDWLREAEEKAKVPKQAGGLWHPYRRKWATERKHLPDVDVAAAGGWAELTSLKKAYQQADDATMLRVVLEAGQLREKRA